MNQTSLARIAFSSLITGFLKTVGVLLGIVFVWIALTLLTAQTTPPRATSTIVLPNHTWKTLPYSPEKATVLKISIDGGIGFPERNNSVTADLIEKIVCDIAQLDLREGNLKGLILTMNSPGGDARDSETIRALIQEAKTRFHIPCIAYVDGLCASGGMMIACAADQIYASPSSLIGNVGVLMGTQFNVAKPMEQYGVLAKTISAGKGKDEFNPFRPWKENEGEDFQEDINQYYDQFVALVCQARPKITPDFLKSEGARIFLAKDAKELGFIDGIEPTYFKCLEKFASTLAIDDEYQVIELQPHFTLGSLFNVGPTSLFKKPVIEHQVTLPGVIHQDLSGKPLFLYRP